MNTFIRLHVLLVLSSLLANHCNAAVETVKTNAAIISNGSLIKQGNSFVRAAWGRVIVNGDIEGLDFAFTSTPNPAKLTANTKAQGAGIEFYAADIPGTDFWLRWQCSGKLKFLSSTGLDIFPSSGLGAVPVTDFFSQIMNGAFPGYSAANVELLDQYDIPISAGEGILYDAPVSGQYPMGTGALVQEWPTIATEVEEAITTEFEYERWKQIAITSGDYLRPTSVAATGFVDSQGNPLYVRSSNGLNVLSIDPLCNAPLTNLSQISMRPWLNSPYTTHIPDRVLFVDTVQGTSTGVPADLQLFSVLAFSGKA